MELTKPKEQTMAYIGPSMNPTLKPGDRLRIVPYDGREIQRGDVIVFTPPGDDTKVIHRVIHIGSQGIKTRGDNCSQIDPWNVSPDRVHGQVVSAQRQHGRRRVFGGSFGPLYCATLRAIHTMESIVTSLFRPAYDTLARAGIFNRLLPDRIAPRVILFSRSEGTELQLLMGRRVIGRLLPGRSQWQIRRPFRLLVDEKSLPENSSKLRL